MTVAEVRARTRDSAIGCWIWPTRNAKGYSFAGGTTAHRHVYEQLVGEIPEGYDVDHLCGIRCCVNPAHLEPVTRRENLLRGDTATARRAAQTHCIHGHEFTPENTYVKKNGTRACRKCHVRWTTEQRRRRRAKELSGAR